MSLPTNLNIPWKPEDLEILEKKGGSILNPIQVQYLKDLIKALKSMYGDIANVINAMSYWNNGTATVENGTTSIAVDHELSKTPSLEDIQVTPTNDLGSAVKFWISGVTATQFTINVNANPGVSTATFVWNVHILG